MTRRTFDHDEARRLRAGGGWTLSELAERYGVTRSTILYATSAEFRERRNVYQRDWAARRRKYTAHPCIDCGDLSNGLRCKACHARKIQRENVGRGPAAIHARAVAEWGEDAFVYPYDPHAPNKTKACPTCGSACDRRGDLCRDCLNQARAEVCIRGHDLTDPDVFHIKTNGSKQCRICDADRNRRRRAEARTAA